MKVGALSHGGDPVQKCRKDKEIPESLGDWERTDMCGRLNARDAQRELTVMGWVARVRDLGQLLFVELRDRTGDVQIVFDADVDEALWRAAKAWRTEYVVAVRGLLRERAPEAVKSESPTGSVEILPKEAKLLSKAETPPFYIRDDIGVDESLRLRYRYLDLRRPEMQRNLELRSKANRSVREFLHQRSFSEIETPYLTRSTPEGARDYLVPTRGRRGEFYALPQSPQLFKQLLMIAGFDRYYQLVRCFRDEDLRADRQPEFTQIDIEMAFTREQAIQSLVEELLAHLFADLWEVKIPTPFPRLTYKDALSRYGTDKPDLRFDLPLLDISEAVEGSSFRVFDQTLKEGGQVKGIAVPGGARWSRKELDQWDQMIKDWGGAGLLWFIWDDHPRAGSEAVRSPVAKHLSEREIKAMAKIAEIGRGDALLVMAGTPSTINPLLGLLRKALGDFLDCIPDDAMRFVWVVNPPLFERDEATGQIQSVHHPFTSPVPEDVPLLATDPLDVRSRAYDIVYNGIELGGGSIRIHQSDLQQAVFRTLGMTQAEIDEKFGFLLEAFQYGVPPHGGIAFGMDRLVMVLAGQGTLRDVIAFPKAASGRDLMVGAPAKVDPQQLGELGLELVIERLAEQEDV